MQPLAVKSLKYTVRRTNLVELLTRRDSVEPEVVHRVVRERVPGFRNCGNEVRTTLRRATDEKEGRFDLEPVQGFEEARRLLGIRPIIEREVKRRRSARQAPDEPTAGRKRGDREKMRMKKVKHRGRFGRR